MESDKLFDLLDDWRHLPAYQLERRADIIFAIHLEKIFEKCIGTKINFIIPEFPVRIGAISEKYPKLNKSFKIDYLVYSEVENKVFLVELKTDLRSLRDNQDWYLKRASEIKLKRLIDGVIDIYKATQQKVKYLYLLEKLEQMNWISLENSKITNKAPDIIPKVIYIQPLSNENTNKIISFDYIIAALKTENSAFTQRFLLSLQKWKTDTNKK